MFLPRKKPRQSPKPKNPAGESESKSPGRPLKRASELTFARTLAMQQSHQAIEHSQPDEADQKQSLSALEQLPVEIIHQVFFYSLEVNLARATPYVTQVLTNESIYRVLILWAYFSYTPHRPVERMHFRPAEYYALNRAEQVRLQRGILSCRWFTLDRLKAAMPVLSRLKMVQVWHQEREHEDDHWKRYKSDVDVSLPDTPGSTALLLPDKDDHLAMERHFVAKLEDEQLLFSANSALIGPVGHGNFLPRIRTCCVYHLYSVTNKSVKGWNGKQGILNALVLPDWLLVGSPWSPEKIEFLQLLRQGLRFSWSGVAGESALSTQALFRGMNNAIEEQREGVLRILAEIYTGVVKNSPLTPSEGGSLPASLFYLATKQETYSSSLLSLLIRADIDVVSRDDAILTHWAIEAKLRGDGLGKWLLNHMEGTVSYGLDADEPLFINGALSPERDDGYYPFPELSFTKEIGYMVK